MLELVTRAWAQLDWFHRAGLLAAALIFLWSVGPAMPQLKSGSSGAVGVDMSKTTIINNGGMQIGGQGNTQNNAFVNAEPSGRRRLPRHAPLGPLPAEVA